jgi:hypothetical protein
MHRILVLFSNTKRVYFIAGQAVGLKEQTGIDSGQNGRKDRISP